MKTPTVIDIFCGAGGFSEGFRQQGFDIVLGVDCWAPAMKTFNYNYALDCPVKNVLDFEGSVKQIEALPDTDVIIGSPPCVSFSTSNKSGKADKSLGVRLTESFLRIVAVKKFQRGSILKAWFMENVPNSMKHLARYYSFKSLGLDDWAKSNGYNAHKIIFSIEGNSLVINSAEFGSPQLRKRAITGELIRNERLVAPEKSHSSPEIQSDLPDFIALARIKEKLPSPNSKSENQSIKDPLYPGILLEVGDFTDHFYDTGLYKSQWAASCEAKKNHPFFGKMSFPENENKPSRTITATNIGVSRESIIYKSEYNRKGDGEYRSPTIREMSCLMGFPITYQFLGASRAEKCRLVGNAVCPSVSRALAKTVRRDCSMSSIDTALVQNKIAVEGFLNLNTFRERLFDNPPRKNKNARFRRHLFKDGNMTVTLSNYDIATGKRGGEWFSSVQYGVGAGFPTENYPDYFFKGMETAIKSFQGGEEFLSVVNNEFVEKVPPGAIMQQMYEGQKSIDFYLNPVDLIERAAAAVNSFTFECENFKQGELFFRYKKIIPKKQLMALYLINRIKTISNKPSLPGAC